MKNATEFDLLHGALTVGQIRNAFFNDETWYGVFEPRLNPTDGTLAERLLIYINFTKEWNERIRHGMSADPREFNQFDDIVKSALWFTVMADGAKNRIVAAPVFFEGGDITWRSRESANSSDLSKSKLNT